MSKDTSLSNIVVSLELARELKEIGYPQDSLFYWFNNKSLNSIDDNYLVVSGRGILKSSTNGLYSAPTATELLNELPGYLRININDTEIELTKDEKKYYSKYRDINDIDNGGFNDTDYVSDESLPNALAKMYIYLKKEELL